MLARPKRAVTRRDGAARVRRVQRRWVRTVAGGGPPTTPARSPRRRAGHCRGARTGRPRRQSQTNLLSRQLTPLEGVPRCVAPRDLDIGRLVAEGTNPRYNREYRTFAEQPPPEDWTLVPGVIDVKTNVVEHPEVVADRLVQFTESIGDSSPIVAGWGRAVTAENQAGRVSFVESPRSLLAPNDRAVVRTRRDRAVVRPQNSSRVVLSRSLVTPGRSMASVSPSSRSRFTSTPVSRPAPLARDATRFWTACFSSSSLSANPIV